MVEIATKKKPEKFSADGKNNVTVDRIMWRYIHKSEENNEKNKNASGDSFHPLFSTKMLKTKTREKFRRRRRRITNAYHITRIVIIGKRDLTSTLSHSSPPPNAPRVSSITNTKI